jgi:predicted dehydrogenase
MHAKAIERNSATFELVAVCDVDPARREEAQRRWGCRTYDDYHRMLEMEAIDMVTIVTRSDQHCPMTCDCLNAGVHALVTKPWAVNETEAATMIAVAEKTGKMLLPWLPARWGSDLKRLRQLVDEDAIGNVFCVRRAVSSFGVRSDWQTLRRCGGGYLLNWGPHIVDPPVMLMHSQVKSVYARMKQTINPGDVEDCFWAVMNLANGVVVHAEYSVAVKGPPSWFLQGDRGTIVVHDRSLRIYRSTLLRPDDPTQTSTIQSSDDIVIEETLGSALYGDETQIYAEIAMAIRGEKPYPVMPADALQLTRVLDAIRLSDQENRVVKLRTN